MLRFDQACSLQREAENLLDDSEREVESLSVLQLARDGDCYACDCEFVALAIQLDTRLVTMDGKLLRAFPDRARSLA